MQSKVNLSEALLLLSQRHIEQRKREAEAARQADERKRAGLQKMAADLDNQIQRLNAKGAHYVMRF